jgi:hypothetical protein
MRKFEKSAGVAPAGARAAVLRLLPLHQPANRYTFLFLKEIIESIRLTER